MNSISPEPVAHSPRTAETEQRARVYKAAQEFEALLLSSLLSPLEQSFSSVPGQDSSSEDYSYMGIQGLAGALSKSGGIGIAELLARQLLRTEVSGGAAGGGQNLAAIDPRAAR
jgi:flagellar protein FlgJ